MRLWFVSIRGDNVIYNGRNLYGFYLIWGLLRHLFPLHHEILNRGLALFNRYLVSSFRQPFPWRNIFFLLNFEEKLDWRVKEIHWLPLNLQRLCHISIRVLQKHAIKKVCISYFLLFDWAGGLDDRFLNKVFLGHFFHAVCNLSSESELILYLRRVMSLTYGAIVEGSP